ncbi:MAG: helix-turn-helix transcriptional regulator, partial [Clostridia bacterium]|nr:helix-turn-helix transcriptional regulator [Clostridia bacterium]
MKKSERTRNSIVEAAAILFSEKGYEATSTKEIALASGVSEASIFKYFITKESLFKAIISSLLEMLKSFSYQSLHADVILNIKEK